MSIEQLHQILTPPLSPVEGGTSSDNDMVTWSDIEKQLGTKLPGDYKSFIRTFGTGSIGSFLWVFNPFSKNPHLNLLNQRKAQLDNLRILHDQYGIECPYPLNAEDGGLLPWGITDNGDTLFWKSQNNSEQWSVVLHEARGPDYEEYAINMTTFLYDLITGLLHSNIIARDLLETPISFRSSRS